MNYDVFISCKSEDYKYAEKIYDFLKNNGINTFLASTELRQMGESEYRRVISQAMKSTYHIIVFASNADYIDSTWVYYEWDMFLTAKLKGRKQGQILTILKDVEVDDINMDLWKYESFTFENYKERILSYVETPISLQRKLEAKEKERLENERKKIEEAKKQEIERKKKELIELAEDYHQKMSALQSIEGRKILHILKELGVTDRKCPVCNEIVPVSKPFCARCGWKFSPTHGIPELNYLIEPENEQLFFSKELFAERSDLQSKLQCLNKSVIDVQHREKELALLNKKYLGTINETAEKNKDLELENRKYEDENSKLTIELERRKDKINKLERELLDSRNSLAEVKHNDKDLSDQNESYQKAIYEAKNKNKELELEKNKFKEMISHLESNLKADENTIQELRKELQSVIEERSILQTQIAKATIGEKNGTPTLSNDTGKKYRITLMDTGAAKLQIVKLIKDVLGWGLKEAKDFADGAPSTFPNLFSENEMQRISHLIEGCGGTLQKVCIQEQPSIDVEKKYKMTLVHAGASKLQMVKLIKEILGWGLKEAKDFVDATPSTFPNFFSEDEMQRISHLIEHIGGVLQKVCIQENTKIISTQKTTMIGRNAPCPCGSGKKYKNCHGKNM